MLLPSRLSVDCLSCQPVLYNLMLLCVHYVMSPIFILCVCVAVLCVGEREIE